VSGSVADPTTSPEAAEAEPDEAGEHAPEAPAEPSPRRTGRRVAQAIYYGSVAAICVGSTVQIAHQLFYTPGAPSPFASCREGLSALARAIDRARAAAPGTDGEDAALARFRTALEPDWRFRDGIAATCRGSAPDERALDAIERLRYAEEHAVRREAGDLAPLRRKVQAIVDNDLGPRSPPGSTTH
jgi:hypothetical protein